MPDILSSSSAESSNNTDLRARIADSLSEFAPLLSIESQIRSAAFYSMSKTPNHNEKCILYCHVSDTVKCALIVNGQILQGKGNRVCDAGELFLPGNTTFKKRVSGNKSIATIAEAAAHTANELIRILDPHVIAIECESFEAQDFIPRFEKALRTISVVEEKCLPEITSFQNAMSGSHAGMLVKLRDEWLEKIITRAI